MESGKYYVISAGNNLTESMTKEQILSAITQAVESHTIADVDTGFVERLKSRTAQHILNFGLAQLHNIMRLQQRNRAAFIC